MSNQIQDVWQDLREKRLWPVALVLVLAILAIPVLLTKSAAQPPAGTPLATIPGQDERVAVKLDDGDAASTGAGSVLDEFAEGDPFTPPGAVAKSGGTGASATATASGPTSEGGPTGGSGSPPVSSPGTPVEVPPPTTRVETSEYEYVADVTFWNGDRRRALKGVRKLDMLPNQSAPVLIFMGTAEEGGNAVFLVDSTLAAAGEGRCVPSTRNCAYVHIGPGSEHEFTTEEGDSYRLRVDEIRRVKARAAATSRLSAGASAGGRPAIRRFELPSLVDLVAVTETETSYTTATAPENDSSVVSSGR